MIRVRVWPHWYGLSGTEEHVEPWREGMVAGDVVPASFRSAAGSLCLYRNSLRSSTVAPLCDNDIVDVSIRPSDPVSIGAFISAHAILSLVVASIALNLIIALLLPKPKGPKSQSDQVGQYSWSGLRNIRIEGSPLMICYGLIRVAPQIINEFTETLGIPSISTYFCLYSFGEGPIYAIGDQLVDTPIATEMKTSDPSHPVLTGAQINGNNLQNFRGVVCSARMGTNQQAVIPGFELTVTTFQVGQLLNQAGIPPGQPYGLVYGTINMTTVPYNSNSAGAQAEWNTYGVSFDIVEDSDRYVVVVSFPNGLYAAQTNGNLANATFQILIRYRELDSLGAPITTGGDNGDGWVYEFPLGAIVAQQQSSFAYEFGGQLADPGSYSPPALGKGLDATATNAYAAKTGPSVPSTWIVGQAIPAVTFEGWFQLSDLGTASPANGHHPLFEIADGPNKRGALLAFEHVTFDNGGGGLQAFWVPAVYVGNGTTIALFYEGYGTTGVLPANYATSGTTYYHVAFTYARQAINGQNRLRIYLNGNLCVEVNQNFNLADMLFSSAGINIGRSFDFLNAAWGGGTYLGVLRADECLIYPRELSQSEIVARYNGGHGIFGVGPADLAQIVCGYHFETLSTTTSADYGTRGNTLTLNNLASAGSVAGAVLNNATVTPKRSHWRIEAMRANLLAQNTFVQDQSWFDSVQGVLDDALAYPNSPLFGLKLKATQQLSGGAPTYTQLIKGRLCPIWDGVSLTNPTITYQWTRNPAWMILDILTNTTYGRGQDYGFSSINISSIGIVDLQSVKEWADYCDGLVWDGHDNKQALDETSTSAPISDLFYSSTLISGSPGIRIVFRAGPPIDVPPSTWIVGGFIGFSGIPFPTTGLNVDINMPNVDGLQIGAVTFNGTNWQVDCYWDKVTYGDPWLDGQFLDTQITPHLSGTVQGNEPRFQYDGALDQFQSVWDSLRHMCATGRAMPVRQGKTIRIKFERPRATVALFGMAQIKQGTFKANYTGSLDQPNSLSIDFLDSALNYTRSTANVDDPTLDASAPEEDLNRQAFMLEGVTRRSQVIRHGLFILAVNRLLRITGSFSVGLDALAVQVGDVVAIAHDLVPWGQSGRVAGATNATTIQLDRTIVLAPSTTYYLRVRSNSGGMIYGSDGEPADNIMTLQITNSAGTYAAGSNITVSSGFPIVPVKQDPYVVFATAEEFLVQITKISLAENFERQIEWAKYDPSVFDVDTLPSPLPDTVQTDSPPSGKGILPLPVSGLVAEEFVRQVTDGSYRSELLVSWVNEPETLRYISAVHVFARFDPAAAFEELRVLDGTANSCRLELPTDIATTWVEVAVSPAGIDGNYYSADESARKIAILTGIYSAPRPPTNLAATLDAAGNATYTWTPPSDARGLSFELRRGGWILGDLIGIAPPGSSSLAAGDNWCSGAANALGEKQPALFLRSRDARGQYSDAAVLTSFDPSLPGGTLLSNLVGGDQSWEDWVANGSWTTGGLSAPAIAGLQVTAYSGRNVLEFSGSDLAGTYTVQLHLQPVDLVPQRMMVEAFVEARSVPPLELSDWLLPLESPRGSRRSLEGALTVLPGEPANPTVEIQWSYATSSGGAYSDWVPFVPGVHFIVNARFRLVCTRPNTDYQIRIFRFHTRMTRIPRQRRERSPALARALQEALIG
jgi:hypothetical protein